MPKLTEKIIHKQVCKYLKIQYPNIVFTSDMSGLKVSIGQSVELKSKRCDRYKIPDLLILHPSGKYHGLMIEVKKSREDVYTTDGRLRKSIHIQEQSKSIERLNAIGYRAAFGCGFDHCIEIIKAYFNTKHISHAIESQNLSDNTSP